MYIIYNMSEALQIGLGVGIPAALIVGTLYYLSIPWHQQQTGPQENIIGNDERGNKNSVDRYRIMYPFSGGKRRKSRKNKKIKNKLLI